MRVTQAAVRHEAARAALPVCTSQAGRRPVRPLRSAEAALPTEEVPGEKVKRGHRSRRQVPGLPAGALGSVDTNSAPYYRRRTEKRQGAAACPQREPDRHCGDPGPQPGSWQPCACFSPRAASRRPRCPRRIRRRSAVTTRPASRGGGAPGGREPVPPKRSVRVQATSQPAVAAPGHSPAESRARPAAPRPKAKPKLRIVEAQAVARDSAPMPRRPSSPAAEALERELLVPAGVALAVVALGGAVVLGASRRALAGARA